MNKTARLYYCVSCHRQTLICSECDRGNIYCAADCARQARTQSLRTASQHYQKSYRGKLNHAARQQRYRARQKQKVTHQGSQEHVDASPLSPTDKSTPKCLYCHFCGIKVADFVRSNYVSRISRYKKHHSSHRHRH